MTTDLTIALGWGHERVQLIHDAATGLQAVIAIHSTSLGPALGGLRIRPYPGGVAEALDDALRLSRAMTLKAAAAGLDLGGGKAVVVDDGDTALRAQRLVRLAAEIEALGGAYITSEDVGTTTADIDLVSQYTSYAVGRSTRAGEAASVAGDPSPDTARTVLAAIRAALSTLDGSDELEGRTVGVLGLGKVGGRLAASLAEAGASVFGYDPAGAAAAPGVVRVDSETELLTRELDVLAPCALGGVIDEPIAETLRCRVVCGAANNPVTSRAVARRLAERGILYVPDFLANCGGLIHADVERRGATAAELEQALDRATARTRDVLAVACDNRRLPLTVAEELACRRVREASLAVVDSA